MLRFLWRNSNEPLAKSLILKVFFSALALTYFATPNWSYFHDTIFFLWVFPTQLCGRQKSWSELVSCCLVLASLHFFLLWAKNCTGREPSCVSRRDCTHMLGQSHKVELQAYGQLKNLIDLTKATTWFHFYFFFIKVSKKPDLLSSWRKLRGY